MRDDRRRLADILNAIDRILAKTSQGQAAFQADEMLQVWVLYHLQLIGEAARALSEDFRRRYPDKVWASAVGLRNNEVGGNNHCPILGGLKPSPLGDGLSERAAV